MDQQKPQNPESIELSFLPITEGLGFHPFSDGLPYAPITKSPRAAQNSSNSLTASSSGATSAGAPQPVFPQKPPANRSQAVPQISVPVAKPLATTPLEKPILNPSLENTQPKYFTKQRYSYGYLFRRIVACMVDVVLSTSIFAGLVRLLIWKEDLNSEVVSNSSVIFVAACLWGAFHWGVVTIQEMAFKTSLGKRMLGLRLTGNSILILFRAFFFLPSLGCLGIGLIWSLFDAKKRCWHDRVVDIQPVDIY